MINNRLDNDQKEKITEWVRENRKFENGDVVTVDYTGDGMFFANAEYGGIPLKVTGVTWRDVTWVSQAGLHYVREDNDEQELIEVFTDDDLHPKGGKTKYVTVTPEYHLEVAVRTDVECNRTISENALVLWEDYEGDLHFKPRDDRGSESLRDGEECPICGYSAERHFRWSNGVVSGGGVSCAVCGYLKERHDP